MRNTIDAKVYDNLVTERIRLARVVADAIVCFGKGSNEHLSALKDYEAKAAEVDRLKEAKKRGWWIV